MALQRPSVYPYTVKEPPGVNIHRLRHAHGLSIRALADRCKPPLDHSTIRRLEHNQGYTQDTLERVAKALGVRVYELFLPPELAEWPTLPPEVRARLAESVADAVARVKSQKRG